MSQAQESYRDALQWEAAARGECSPPIKNNAPSTAEILLGAVSSYYDSKLKKQREKIEAENEKRRIEAEQLEQQRLRYRREYEEKKIRKAKADEYARTSYNVAMHAGRSGDNEKMFSILRELWDTSGARDYEYENQKDKPFLLSSNLGLCYYYGRGTAVNYDRASEAFTSGAELGQALSIFMLGRMYENGHGKKKDMVKAIQLYDMAREKGYDGEKVAESIKRILNDPNFE